MAQATSKSNNILFHKHAHRYILGVAILAVAVGVGLNSTLQGEATTAGSLYVQPSSTSANLGTDVVLAVRVNSGADPVNAVETHLTYPADKLQYVSTSSTGGSFPVVAQSSGGLGQVTLVAATNGGAPAVSGDALVAYVTFRTIAGGNAVVDVNNNSVAVSSITNQRVPTVFTASTVKISNSWGN